MKIKFRQEEPNAGYKHLLEISWERAFMIVDYNPLICLGSKAATFSLINICCMKDIMIPGFEFNITLPFIRIFYRINYPASDEFFKEMSKRIEEHESKENNNG